MDTIPNGEMKRRVEAACKKNDMKIKVVEKIGSTMKKELQWSNPIRTTTLWKNRLRHMQPGVEDKLPETRTSVRDVVQELRRRR